MSTAEPATADPTTRPFQFTLRQLTIVMIFCSIGLAITFHWGPLGFVLSYFTASLAAMGWGAFQRLEAWSSGGLAMLILGIVMTCLAPDLGLVPHPPPRRMQCSNHLKQIGIALHNYHDVYGSFPPAYIADADGKPMHSWRVLILPFMEQKPLYDSYSFDEPWDGPNNRKLHDVLIPTYRCPAAQDKQPRWETSYAAIVGPQTMWPGEKATKLRDLADGTSNTLMVTEVLSSGIHWMEPRDLHIVQTPMIVNPKRGTGISSLHPSSVVALFADGHVAALTNNTPPEIIRALLTIDGGETISDLDF